MRRLSAQGATRADAGAGLARGHTIQGGQRTVALLDPSRRDAGAAAPPRPLPEGPGGVFHEMRAGLAAARSQAWEEAVVHFRHVLLQSGPPGESLFADARAWYALALLQRGHGGDRQLAARVIVDAERSLPPVPAPPAGARALAPAASAGRDSPAAVLSSREQQVLERIAAGDTNIQIANALSISVHTVVRHVTHILEKLAVPNRTAAVAFVHARTGPVNAASERGPRPVATDPPWRSAPVRWGNRSLALNDV